jgi:glycosyltransferase involved in cell wall biosynthesis
MQVTHPRLVFLIPTWEVNGVSTVSLLLAEGLAARGFCCEVVGTDLNQDNPPPGLIPEGVRHRRLTPKPLARRWFGLRRLALARARRTIDRALFQLLDDGRPTVLVPGFELAWSAWPQGLPANVSVLGIIHSDDPWWYAAAETLSRHTQHLVAVSSRIQKQLQMRLPHWRGTVHHIPNGVKCPTVVPARNRQPGDPLRLIYAGRLVEQQKRVSRLPKLLAALETAGVPFRMEIAGEGPEEGVLRLACQKWVSEGRVHFLGRLNPEEVRTAFRRADLFVLLSDYEGLPMGLLEAMSEGCVPLVSKGLSGIEELVREEDNGWIVQTENVGDNQPEFWARLIAPGVFNRMRTSAWSTIKESKWESNAMLVSYEKQIFYSGNHHAANLAGRASSVPL